MVARLDARANQTKWTLRARMRTLLTDATKPHNPHRSHVRDRQVPWVFHVLPPTRVFHDLPVGRLVHDRACVGGRP